MLTQSPLPCKIKHDVWLGSPKYWLTPQTGNTWVKHPTHFSVIRQRREASGIEECQLSFAVFFSGMIVVVWTRSCFPNHQSFTAFVFWDVFTKFHYEILESTPTIHNFLGGFQRGEGRHYLIFPWYPWLSNLLNVISAISNLEHVPN